VEITSADRGQQRFSVRLARLGGVQRLQAARRAEQQPRRVGARR